MGFALYAAQNGETDPSAKPLKGFGGASVMEIVAPFSGDTWRAVYTVRFQDVVLCATRFAEEIQIGNSHAEEGTGFDSPANGVRRKRLQREQNPMKTKPKSTRKTKVAEGSGNVFADLGLPHAEQELMKARLTLQIYQIIQKRGLTQTEAGKILGIPQPQVSALARNRAGNFSVGRLIDFLTALGQDVQITVTPARKQHGQLSVVLA